MASALLGESPPTLSVSRLVRLAGVFGINPNQARVALSRMVARGEVSTDGAGSYTLSGRLLERARRQSVSRSGATGEFDGEFHVVVVTASGDPATVRQTRRAALRTTRLGELRGDVWLRPGNLEIALDVEVRASVVVLRAVPEEDPAALCASVFDLLGWARRAIELVDELASTTLEGPASLAEGFVLNADVLRHLQRDPLLPASLLEPAWPGPQLRASYEEFDASFRTVLATVHRSMTACAPSRDVEDLAGSGLGLVRARK